jgi:hypothetical protein
MQIGADLDAVLRLASRARKRLSREATRKQDQKQIDNLIL